MPTPKVTCTTYPECRDTARHEITAGDGPDGRRNRTVIYACLLHLQSAQGQAQQYEHRTIHTIATPATGGATEGTPHV